MNHMKLKFVRSALVLTALSCLSSATLLAGQGAQRMLYAVPNNSFFKTRPATAR